MTFRYVDTEAVALGGRSTNSGTTVTSPVPFELSRYASALVKISWVASNLAGLGFSIWADAATPVNANSATLIASVAQVAVDSFWVTLAFTPTPLPYAIGYVKATNPVSNYAGTWSATLLGKSY